MQTSNSITITVCADNGSFVASTSDAKPTRVSHAYCPRQAAVDLAEKLWGNGKHLVYCSEVHQDRLGANFILTHAEALHA